MTPTKKTTIWDFLAYILMLVGIGATVRGAVSTTTVELGFGGDIEMVTTSWWEFQEERQPLMLRDNEWHARSDNGDWYPVVVDDWDPYADYPQDQYSP